MFFWNEDPNLRRCKVFSFKNCSVEKKKNKSIHKKSRTENLIKILQITITTNSSNNNVKKTCFKMLQHQTRTTNNQKKTIVSSNNIDRTSYYNSNMLASNVNEPGLIATHLPHTKELTTMKTKHTTRCGCVHKSEPFQ